MLPEAEAIMSAVFPERSLLCTLASTTVSCYEFLYPKALVVAHL